MKGKKCAQRKVGIPALSQINSYQLYMYAPDPPHVDENGINANAQIGKLRSSVWSMTLESKVWFQHIIYDSEI